MAIISLNGYFAVETAIAWTSGQSFDSLTDTEWTDLSDEIDNSTNLYRKVDLYIHLASAAFTGGNSAIEIYLVPTVDGTNYPGWVGNSTAANVHHKQYYVTSGLTTQTTAAQDIVVRDIPLPSGKYKWGFRNSGNVTLAASGNTVEWRAHSEKF